MTTPIAPSLSPAGQSSPSAADQASNEAFASVLSRSCVSADQVIETPPSLVPFVRALARNEARRLHRRERGFGLPGTALLMITAGVLLAVIMMAQHGRLALPW